MGFFDKIQSLDESMKIKILIGTTAIIMVIVVALWYLYFNSIVIGTLGQAATPSDQSASGAVPTAQPVPVAVQPSAGPSIWQNIAGVFTGIAQRIKSVFQAPGQYDVQPSH